MHVHISSTNWEHSYAGKHIEGRTALWQRKRLSDRDTHCTPLSQDELAFKPPGSTALSYTPHCRVLRTPEVVHSRTNDASSNDSNVDLLCRQCQHEDSLMN